MSVNYKYIVLIITGCVVFISILLGGGLSSAIDFAPIYYSSQLISVDENIYNFDLLREIIIGNGHAYTAVHYLYPPFFAAIMQPLGQLSLTTALAIWLGINSFAFFIGIGFLIKLLFPNKIKYYLIILTGLLLFYPTTNNLQLGQVNPIIFLLLCGGLALMIKQKNLGSGIMLGIASLIKVFPIIFLIHALFLKKWKIFIYGTLTILSGILLTIILAGLDSFSNYTEYFTNVIPLLISGNLPGWLPGSSEIGYLDILWTTSQSTALISITTKSLLSIFFIFIGYRYLFKKQPTNQKSILLEFSFLAAMMVIASAFSFHHYLLWLIIPLIILYKIYLENKNKYLLISILIAFFLSAIPPFFIRIILPANINEAIYPFINPGLWSVIIILIIITIQYFKKSVKKQLE